LEIEMSTVALFALGVFSGWAFIKALQWAVWNLIPTTEEDDPQPVADSGDRMDDHGKMTVSGGVPASGSPGLCPCCREVLSLELNDSVCYETPEGRAIFSERSTICHPCGFQGLTALYPWRGNPPLKIYNKFAGL
jgi:hypothetical protein